MRRKEFSLSRSRALALLSEARELHLASTNLEGQPVLRTVNPVVMEGRLYFHGSPKGEKTECMGRPAVAQCETVIATIPSYFIDPKRACPATTFYQSVQIHGVLEPVDDRINKARVLSALMEKFQAEGGYEAIQADDDLYRAAVRGLMVWSLALDDLTAKSKLGQNRSTEELSAVVKGLWKRGAPGDLRALELTLEANPRVKPPPFLRGPVNTRLCVDLGEEDASQVSRLLEGQYWTEGVSPEALVKAHLGSAAWVAARSADGHVLASARAIADGARHAYVADVVVAPEWRNRGLGKALVRLLLDHPALRDVASVRLETTNADSFYEGLGFAKEASRVVGGAPVVGMVARRANAF